MSPIRSALFGPAASTPVSSRVRIAHRLGQIVLLVAILVFVSVNDPMPLANASVADWRQIGPPARLFRSLAVSPQYASDRTIFAGAHSGPLYRSIDGGATWAPVIPDNGSFSVLAMSPVYGLDRTVFAVSDGKVYRSVDAGSNWQQVFDASYVVTLAIAPNFASAPHVAIGTFDGIRWSTDGGTTWGPSFWPGRPAWEVSALALSPGYASDQIYMAAVKEFDTCSPPLFDNWDLWHRSPSSGFQIRSRFFHCRSTISAIAFSTDFVADRGVIFVGDGNVHRSTDGGYTWYTTLYDALYALVISPTFTQDQTVVVAGFGLHISRDRGLTWTDHLPRQYSYAVALSPNYSSDQSLIVSTDSGLMARGAAWAPAPQPTATATPTASQAPAPTLTPTLTPTGADITDSPQVGKLLRLPRDTGTRVASSFSSPVQWTLPAGRVVLIAERREQEGAVWWNLDDSRNGGGTGWFTYDSQPTPRPTGSVTPAPPGSIDLSVDAAAPVQVLEGRDLVRGKATAVKAVIRKTGSSSVTPVSVRFASGALAIRRFWVAEESNMDPTTHKLLSDNSGHPLTFGPADTTKIIYFFSDLLTPTGSSFQGTVTVDDTGAIAEANETNNSATLAPVPVHETRWSNFGLFAPDLGIYYFRTDWGHTSQTTFDSYVDRTNSFLRGVLPAANDRFTLNALGGNPASTGLFTGSDSKLDQWELGLWIAAKLIGLRLQHPLADRFIAVTPPGWFESHTTGFDRVVGVAYPNMRDLVVAEALTPARPNGSSVVAHELGHSFGLNLVCEDYYEQDADCGRKMTEHAPSDRIGTLVPAGLWVEQRIPIQIPSGRSIYSFMGAYDDGGESWASAVDYDRLFSDHRASSSAARRAADASTGPVIIAAGTVSTNHAVNLSDWYVVPQGNLSNLAPGPYSFEYRDAAGTLLASRAFDIGFTVGGRSVSETPFVFTIPYFANTTAITVSYNGQAVARRAVTPHAPRVDIVAPRGGDAVRFPVRVTWQGSDADGDGLSYALLVSGDEGAHWTTVAVNVKGTSYELTADDLPTGSRYTIKVLATDALNTAERVLDAPVTVRRPTFIPLVSRAERATASRRR